MVKNGELLLESIELLAECSQRRGFHFFNDQIPDRWRLLLSSMKALSSPSQARIELDSVWTLFVHCALIFSAELLRSTHDELQRVFSESLHVLIDFSLSAADHFAGKQDSLNLRLVLRLVSVLLVNSALPVDDVKGWCSSLRSQLQKEDVSSHLKSLDIHEYEHRETAKQLGEGWLPQLANMSNQSASMHVLSESVSFNRVMQGCAKSTFADKDGPCRVFNALCTLITPSIEKQFDGDIHASHCMCILDGLDLANECRWDLMVLRICVAKIARIIARTTSVQLYAADCNAVKSSKILNKILEFDGRGANHVHFKRNLEILVLCNIFCDEFGQEANVTRIPAAILELSLKLVLRLLERVIADGRQYSEDLLLGCDDFEVECRKCRLNVHEQETWDCTKIYTPLQRLAIFLRVSGQSFLLLMLSLLSSSFHPSTCNKLFEDAVSTESPGAVESNPSSAFDEAISSVKESLVNEGLGHNVNQTCDLVSSAEDLKLQIFNLLSEGLFNISSVDYYGPFLTPLMSSAVLNGFLSLLEATPPALNRVGVRCLAGKLVENGFLDLRARQLMLSILACWPGRIPTEVLLLVARLAFRHALRGITDVDGSVAEMLWNAKLTSMETCRSVDNPPSARDKEGDQPVSDARVLAILFNTLEPETRGKILLRCIALFISKVDAGDLLDLKTLSEVLGFLSYMLSNFSKVPPALVWKIESLMKGDPVSRDFIAGGGAWGINDIKEMYAVGAENRGEMKDDSSLYVLLEIVPPSHVLDLQSIPY